MPVALGLMAAHGCVSAEAYAQRAMSVVTETTATNHSPSASSYATAAPPVFFPSRSLASTPASTPYRSLMFVDLRQNILPQDIVAYLLNRSLMTGHYYSLFRHGPASAPEGYEVREGSPSGCDRSVLGGPDYDAMEELFFTAAWVAHVHPPSQSPLPTHDDLAALAARAELTGGRLVRHSLFGFLRGEPVCIELQAFYDPLFREVSILHRASEELATAVDRRVQEFISSYR